MKMKWILSCLLALALAPSITPSVVAAEEPVGGKTIYVDAKNGDDAQEGVGTTSDKAYKTVEKAVAAANSGDTIELGTGNYTLYGVASTGHTKDKDLTFVGQGTDKTGWNIGALVPDPDKYGTEYNGDYSFDGAKTITFKNMTLRSGGNKDYLGFIRINNTIVENCVINGKTAYWGYLTATFRNTTFNCPEGDYALWTYSSPVMTFDNCTFNSSGKVINVYTDFSAGKYDITVNYNDCVVNSNTPEEKKDKAVMNINDSNMGDYKYIINISGNNTVNGVTPDNLNEEYLKEQKDITCSRLFEFNTKYGNGNSGRTVVSIDGIKVWENGNMIAHEIDTANDSYTDGYKDNAFDITTSEWTTNADGTVSRTVTKTCKYCGDQEIFKEYQGKLTYDANGGEGAIDSATGVSGESVTVAENGFTRNDYTFTGWNTQADGKGTAYKPGDSFKLTDEDTVLYAQWSKNAPAQVNVSYDANGGTGTMKSITGDVGSKIVIEQNGFARSGYTFTGWNTQADGKGIAYKAGDSFALTDKDTVLYAQWSKNSGSTGTGTNGTAKPTDSPKTGDNSNLALWFVLLLVSGGAAIGTTVVSRKKKYNR